MSPQFRSTALDRSPRRKAGDSWAEPCAPDGGTYPCPSDTFARGLGVAIASQAEIPAGTADLRRLPPQPGLTSLPSPKGRGLRLALIRSAVHGQRTRGEALVSSPR